MPNELDAFLGNKEGTPDGAQTPAEAPVERSAHPDPPAESKPSAAPTEAPAKASEPEDDDRALPVTGGDNRTVPFSALEKVRNDWKSKHAAAEAEAKLLRQQLEEAKRPPPAPPAPPQQYIQPLPDPQVDPVGYVQGAVWRQQQAMLNERLNMSEAMLRDKIGEEKVSEYVADFQKMAQTDRALFDKLYAQPHPYAWMTREVDRHRLMRDVGDDPAAFRAKVEAEARAKWEAERAAPPTIHVSPAAGQPPSLASARSMAGRTTSTFTGPPPLEQLFPGVENRRRAH